MSARRDLRGEDPRGGGFLGPRRDLRGGAGRGAGMPTTRQAARKREKAAKARAARSPLVMTAGAIGLVIAGWTAFGPNSALWRQAKAPNPVAAQWCADTHAALIPLVLAAHAEGLDAAEIEADVKGRMDIDGDQFPELLRGEIARAAIRAPELAARPDKAAAALDRACLPHLR